MDLTFSGIPAVILRMEDLRAQMVNVQVAKALRAGGEIIAEAMRAAAPLGPQPSPKSTSLEPGEIKEDIKVRLATEDDERYALIGPTGKTAHVARFVEYGHRQVRGKNTIIAATDGEVPAHPIKRASWEQPAPPTSKA